MRHLQHQQLCSFSNFRRVDSVGRATFSTRLRPSRTATRCQVHTETDHIKSARSRASGKLLKFKTHRLLTQRSLHQTACPLVFCCHPIMDAIEPTSLLFHHNGDQYTHQGSLQACIPLSELPEADRSLFKDPPDNLFAVVLNETIFHPQGGGQPSDIGTLSTASASFEVLLARTSISQQGVVLHFGTFKSPENTFKIGEIINQEIDSEKRVLYSKYHTAGHVLGSAVRHLLEKEVDGFDELKASHFPDSASCEFAGLIASSHKDAIQKKVDEFVAAAMPVEIDWWSEDDFEKAGVARLIPDTELREAMGIKPGEKFRVVKIVGAEVYPCGGTHIHTTDQCGKVVARKISRSKGQSRVSYTLPDA